MAPEGGVNEIEIEFVVLPETLSKVGADKIVYPINVDDELEVPFVLIATRLKLYDIPLVKPLRTYDSALALISTFVALPPVVAV